MENYNNVMKYPEQFNTEYIHSSEPDPSTNNIDMTAVPAHQQKGFLVEEKFFTVLYELDIILNNAKKVYRGTHVNHLFDSARECHKAIHKYKVASPKTASLIYNMESSLAYMQTLCRVTNATRYQVMPLKRYEKISNALCECMAMIYAIKKNFNNK